MGLGIKKNDNVVVIAGDEKGKKGRVLSVNAAADGIIVEGINMIKKHLKPSKQHQQGGIIDREAQFSLSNVMLVCPKCDKPTRLANKLLENNKKIRACKKCGEVIE